MAGALMGSYSTLPAGGATVYDGTATHEPSNAETIYHISGQSGYGAPGYAYAGGNGQAQGYLPPAIQAVVDVIQGGGTVAAGLAETKRISLGRVGIHLLACHARRRGF